MINKRQCHKCKEFKEIPEFSTQNQGNKCKECYRKFKKEYYQRPEVKKKEREHFIKGYFKRTYGITICQYQEMLLKQEGKCAICKTEWTRINPKSKKAEQLSVDHCHKTGKIRGLLCGKCNIGMGYFQDDIERLENCIIYLKLNSQ
jgi:hypothetical protein